MLHFCFLFKQKNKIHKMCVLEGGGVRTLKLSINLLSNLEFLSAIMGGGGS